MTQLKIKVAYDIETGVIKWEGLDFEVNVPTLIQIEMEDWEGRLPMDRQASCHGIKQKVNDSRAGMTEAKGYTHTQMVEAMQEVIDHIANGQWNKTKEGGKGKTLGLTKFISTMKSINSPPEKIIELGKSLYPEIDWDKQTI